MLSLYLSMVETEEQRSIVEQIYHDYEQTMYHSAFAVLHNKQDAEDAVHEAFVRIITHIEKLTEIETVKRKSFVVITAKHSAIDILRKRQKQDYDELSDDIADNRANVEREVFDGFEYERLKSAIYKLPENQRNVLILRYFHDMQTSDIADIVGGTSGAVRSKLNRATGSLMKILNEEE